MNDGCATYRELEKMLELLLKTGKQTVGYTHSWTQSANFIQ